MRHRRSLAGGIAAAAAVLVLAAGVTSAVQTFPDPFGGDGLFVDIGAGSQGTDVGDAFFLHDEDVLRIRLFLDAPNTFIETHVCLSAEPFTERIPPGQCQFQAQGAAAGSYDIGLPPASFPSGTEPFDDPFGSFCVQVHVSFTRPGLALTAAGGGGAFAGWQSGTPFYGNVCIPPAPEPPPSGGFAELSKTGELVGSDLVFTVTVSNPTTEIAPEVVVFDALPTGLTWVLPSDCAFGPVGIVARCELGDLDGGEEVDLEFSATLPDEACGTFVNHASTFGGDALRASSADWAAVDVPCPPDPPADPLILLTKEVSATSITAPGTILYTITFENAGPGAASNVTAVDELPRGPVWSIGSGSNVCTLSGSTLSCFAETVPDGVFEVLEVTGTVGPDGCGAIDNESSVTFSGGPDSGSVTAVAPTVEISGCPTAETPVPAPVPPSSGPAASSGTDDDSSGLPDTRTSPAPTGSGPAPVLLAAAAVSIAVLGWWHRPRWRSARHRIR